MGQYEEKMLHYTALCFDELQMVPGIIEVMRKRFLKKVWKILGKK